MSGSQVGRCFAAKTRAMAVLSSASAPSPYTVSVGKATMPDLRSNVAARWMWTRCGKSGLTLTILLLFGATVAIITMLVKNTAILLVDCPDRKGIVADISEFLYRHSANIIHNDQHQDADLGLFLTRVEWELGDFKLAISDFKSAFAPVAEKYQMRWRLETSAARPRLAIMVSQYTHCLADLLYRHESGELAW